MAELPLGGAGTPLILGVGIDITDIRRISKALDRWGERFTMNGHGRCCVCNRKLTNPDSISSGVGPVCQGK